MAEMLAIGRFFIIKKYFLHSLPSMGAWDQKYMKSISVVSRII
jgi:hypothetical protein